jgi:hypothetical protein
MEYNPSVFHRELQKNLRDFATFTDGFLMAFSTSIPMESPMDCRTHVWHVSVCMNTDGIADVYYRRITHVWHVSVCTITDGMSDGGTGVPTDRKVWQDFWTFFVRISINFRQNYQRNLIPPTAINFRR